MMTRNRITNGLMVAVVAMGIVGLTTSAHAGILDDVSSASASAAYSSRKLSDAYAGSALRLRRSSDSAEMDFGFVGAYLDESAISAWLGGSTGYVTTWYDQSGNGNNYVQATASQQPIYTPDAVGPEQRPVVTNTGNDDQLVSSFTQGLPYTRVLYANRTGGSSVIAGTTGTRQELQSNGATSLFYFDGAAVIQTGLSPSFPDYRLIDYEWTGTSSDIGLDGGTRATVTVNNGSSPTGFILGNSGAGNFGITGNFLEEIIFDGALSAGDRSLINSSVNQYLTETTGGGGATPGTLIYGK